ncbi:MAG: phenylalanine--tRNA ligase subunit alpha, partial [Patescibacteria group bacterium]
MTATPDELQQLKQEALPALAEVETARDLEAWRVKYIGRKGAVPLLLRAVKNLPEAERKRVGKEANTLRHELEELYQRKKGEVSQQFEGIRQPGGPAAVAGKLTRGHLHPITLTIQRVRDILAGLGFYIAEGPEVEEAHYNFDLLNIPLEHTARGVMDTFQIQEPTGLVLRTHTSPVQVRAVLENNFAPPFKVASPGRVFRAERTDATHESP